MTHDNDTPSEFPRVDSLPPLSGESTAAPWARRRMYASALPGASGSHDDESETGTDVGVAETAVWGAFLHRIIKAKPTR